MILVPRSSLDRWMAQTIVNSLLPIGITAVKSVWVLLKRMPKNERIEDEFVECPYEFAKSVGYIRN